MWLFYQSISIFNRTEPIFGWAWALPAPLLAIQLYIINNLDVMVIAIEILYLMHLNSCRWQACLLCKVSLLVTAFDVWENYALLGLQSKGMSEIQSFYCVVLTIWFGTWISVHYKKVIHYSGVSITSFKGFHSVVTKLCPATSFFCRQFYQELLPCNGVQEIFQCFKSHVRHNMIMILCKKLSEYVITGRGVFPLFRVPQVTSTGEKAFIWIWGRLFWGDS